MSRQVVEKDVQTAFGPIHNNVVGNQNKVSNQDSLTHCTVNLSIGFSINVDNYERMIPGYIFVRASIAKKRGKRSLLKLICPLSG